LYWELKPNGHIVYHVDIGRMPHGPASAEAREEKDHK